MKVATLRVGETELVARVDLEQGTWSSPSGLHGATMSDVAASAELQGLLARSPATGDLDRARLCAPVPRPSGNVICVGKNYRDHAAEFARSGYDSARDDTSPSYPVFFTKAACSVIGPGDPVVIPQGLTEAVDYEAELAVVVGASARGIDARRADKHIFGYTIVNDVTARDLQKRHQQWFLGKSLETFCPMGPWIVTADEIDASDLRITCDVNGEPRQDARTSDMIFPVARLLADLSAAFTLRPGDVVATGTPAGVGAGSDPPRFLTSGDEMTVTIAGIGELTNPVVLGPSRPCSAATAAQERNP